jgi:hypothetical protein
MVRSGPVQRYDRLDSPEFHDLLAWMVTPERPPAKVAFPAGVLHDCATAFEMAIAVLVRRDPPISSLFEPEKPAEKPTAPVDLTAPPPRTPDSSAAPPG